MRISDKRLAQIWFYARPDEWDSLEEYVKKFQLKTCGILIRSGYSPTWLNLEEEN